MHVINKDDHIIRALKIKLEIFLSLILVLDIYVTVSGVSVQRHSIVIRNV
jgi:hypothetical protein